MSSMLLSRRCLLGMLSGSVGDPLLRGVRHQIDRRVLVSRHNVVIRQPDAMAPLSVGNGEFAFTADVTGLQSFPEHYESTIPLAIQSQWGWHTFPNRGHYRLEDTFEPYDTAGRAVDYPTRTRTPAGQWLRQNPHRLGLARIGFEFRGKDASPVELGDIGAIEQRLDLWTGTLVSKFSVRAAPLQVWTWAHPDLDMIAVRVKAPPRESLRVRVRVEFPYGSGAQVGDPGDWNHPALHRTTISSRSTRHVEFRRQLDRDEYFVRVGWPGRATVRKDADHLYQLQFEQRDFEFVAAFSPDQLQGTLPSVRETEKACRRHWARFWSDGGAIDLSESTDHRAHELERRIVLSQYLTAIQCAGSMPPQETGLTFNSWYGKFHLEMHWWHAAQFALWGRSRLLERSLPWYRKIMPEAKRTALRQGYAGVRWPKMVGPHGRESPSRIGPLLIWQQPHLISLCELLYRAHPTDEVLNRYKDLVLNTAEFMASYPLWDEQQQRYVLGPPLIPAQELHPPRTTYNPAFELAYWRFGLQTAQKWRQRLAMRRSPHWDHVLERLSALPVVNGLYVNAESDPVTFRDPKKRHDHPTLLAPLGLLPGDGVDREIMRRTLRKVMKTWNWDRTWGWDYPMTAMTAARVGEPELATEALLMETEKNRYLPNGHNFQGKPLTIYLPGNGALLLATAMMAAGWDGAPNVNAPGFPRNGSWVVRWESLQPLP